MARDGPRGQARPAGHARLPHVHHGAVLRYRPADGDVVREERPQHLRHASVHPSAVEGGGSGVGGAQRLGDLQGHRADGERTGARRAGVEKDLVLVPTLHDTPERTGHAVRRHTTGSAANASRCPARPCRRWWWSSATTRTCTRSSLRSGRCSTSWATAARVWSGIPRRRSSSSASSTTP